MDAGVEELSSGPQSLPKSGGASGILQKPRADRKFPVHRRRETEPGAFGKRALPMPIFDLLIAFYLG
jgi:hypothetical protein